MPIVSPEALKTHMYPEIMDEICREDPAIVLLAIATAEQEAKLYVMRYDVVTLFGTADTPATVTDPLLQHLVKSIACWRLVQLCHVSIDYEKLNILYAESLTTLKNIKEGKLEPESWPYAAAAAEQPDGDVVHWNSRTKRQNEY
jgi:hypothetical protein